MNRCKRITLLAVVAVMALALMAVVVPADDSSAASQVGFSSSDIYSESFVNNSSGNIHVPLTNHTDEDLIITVKATDVNEGHLYCSVDSTVKANTQSYAILTFQISDAGDKDILISCSPTDYFGDDPITYSATITVHVDQSVWTQTTTYLVIIALVIIIVIAAYLHIRSQPKKKTELTFTDLEHQKILDKVGPESKSSKNVISTEKRRYDSKAVVKPKNEFASKDKKIPKSSLKNTSSTEKVKYKSSRRK